MRDCTYAHLPEYSSVEVSPNRVTHLYLCPIGVIPIIDRTIKSYKKNISISDSNDITDENLSDFFIALLKFTIKAVLGTRSQIENNEENAEYFATLFNHNYRRLIEFVVYILTLLFDRIYRVAKEDLNEHDIIKKIHDIKFLSNYINDYEVNEILLMGNFSVFNNFFWRASITDNIHETMEKGLIDNPLQYLSDKYESNKNGNPNTFVKIKILQMLLNSNKEELTSPEILIYLSNMGYTGITNKNLQFVLKNLRSSGFIKTSLVNESGVIYKISGLGRFVYSNYYSRFNITFIEMIIQKTLFPQDVYALMLPSRKYDGYYYEIALRHKNIDGTVERLVYWVFSGIVNAIIFFHFARQVEMNEKKFLDENKYKAPTDFPMLKIYDDIIANKEDVTKLVKNYDNIFRTTVDNTYISLEGVESFIASAKDNIDKVVVVRGSA